MGDYEPPFVAVLLHSLPHLNIKLRLVNSTFNPESEVYLEVSWTVLLCLASVCILEL